MSCSRIVPAALLRAWNPLVETPKWPPLLEDPRLAEQAAGSKVGEPLLAKGDFNPTYDSKCQTAEELSRYRRGITEPRLIFVIAS